VISQNAPECPTIDVAPNPCLSDTDCDYDDTGDCAMAGAMEALGGVLFVVFLFLGFVLIGVILVAVFHL